MKTFIIKSLSAILLILAPLTPIILSLGVLIFIDFLTGIYKSYKLKEAITSRKMSLTVSKLLLYNLAILSGFLVETYLVEFIPFVKIISGFIAITELKSVSENVASITGVNYWAKIQEALKRNKN